MKLYIDDLRTPKNPEQWSIVRSSEQAIEFVKKNGVPEHISFDHDLGGNDTSRVFVLWLMGELIEGNLCFPDCFSFNVHSANPIGSDWIRGTMLNLIGHFKK